MGLEQPRVRISLWHTCCPITSRLQVQSVNREAKKGLDGARASSAHSVRERCVGAPGGEAWAWPCGLVIPGLVFFLPPLASPPIFG